MPAKSAPLLAATQRPVAESALNEPSGRPAWKSLPSWFIYGTGDLNIPPALQPFMARRAGAKRIVSVKGASQPDQWLLVIDHQHAFAFSLGGATSTCSSESVVSPERSGYTVNVVPLPSVLATWMATSTCVTTPCASAIRGRC